MTTHLAKGVRLSIDRFRESLKSWRRGQLIQYSWPWPTRLRATLHETIHKHRELLSRPHTLSLLVRLIRDARGRKPDREDP